MNFDVDTTKDVLEITRHGASAIDAIIGSVNRLKLMFQSTQSAPVQEVRAAITDLGEQVMKAREENVELRKQAIELRDQIIDMKRREEKFAGYEIFETALGSVVLMSSKEVKPVHYLCPNCHDAGVRTILQGNSYSKQCTASPSHGWFHFEDAPPLPRRR